MISFGMFVPKVVLKILFRSDYIEDLVDDIWCG